MSKLTVTKLCVDVQQVFSYSNLRSMLSLIKWNSLAYSPWNTEYPYRPHVSFQIAHTGQSIILHFSVQEEFVKAQYIRANEHIWEDSCVEFFISLDNKQTYFNFEFNPLGAGLIGYGPAVKASRVRLSPAEIDSVAIFTELSKSSPAEDKKWSTIWVIPCSLLGVGDLSSRTAHANFYKCGDGLPNPHFITWQPIENPTPNFHLPQFFGEVIFE